MHTHTKTQLEGKGYALKKLSHRYSERRGGGLFMY